MYKKLTIAILLLCAALNSGAQCNATVCAGSTTTSACLLSLVSNLIAGTWNSSNTAVATVNSLGVITGVSAGTATVTYHFIIFYTVAVTVNPLPTAAPANNGPVCSGQTLALTANAGGAATYLWAGPNGFVSTIANPSIAAATPLATGVYTLTESTSLGCVAAFTENAIVGTPFSIAINETSPLAISNERIQTFCSGQTLTLAVAGTPSLPSSGPSYTWSGPSSIVTTSSTFSPSLSAGSATAIVPYTVSATYNGCSATTKDTVVVPATGSSPCEYFKVNGYRSIAGLSPLSGCGDCNTIQPFHTILSSRLDSATVRDTDNYYIVNNAVLKRSAYKRDMFFMNGGVQLLVDTVTPVTLSGCHFFGSPSFWNGIRVAVSGTAAGHLSIKDNTLIERVNGVVNGLQAAGAYVAATGSYYNTSGMSDIINCDGAIYNRNYIGAAVYNYAPSLSAVSASTPLPFSISNSVFTNRELASANTGSTSATNYPFSWQPVSALKAVTSGVANPVYGIGAYTAYSVAATGHTGVYMGNTGNNQLSAAGTSSIPATYTYNYATIGSTVTDTFRTRANLFDSLDFGVQVDGSNAKLYNNTFSNVRLTGLWVNNGVNDVQSIGDTGGHTNNRFYNNGYGVFSSGSWNLTCKNGSFSAVNSSTAITPSIGIYLVKTTGHDRYEISGNSIYNYGVGAYMQYLGFDPYSFLNGTTLFRNNVITGKTTTSSTESTTTGIKVVDLRAYAGSNGYISIDSNILSGVNDGISLYAYTQNVQIDYNSISLASYSASSTQSGIFCSSSPYVSEIKSNTVKGFGYDCSPDNYGINIHNVGDTGHITDIACNRVTDLNTGFEFELSNHVLWENNEMRRTKTGIALENSASMGMQGGACAPVDNHWEGDTGSGPGYCASAWPGWNGSGIRQTYVGEGVDPTASILYVRNSAHYIPTLNSAHPASVPYSLAASTLVDATAACTTGLPTASSCSESSPAAKHANTETTAIQPVNGSAASADINIYPNPNDGGMTVTVPASVSTLVNMSIINTVGTVVYSAPLQTVNGKASVALQGVLLPGVYVVQLTGMDVNRNKRIVVSR